MSQLTVKISWGEGCYNCGIIFGFPQNGKSAICLESADSLSRSSLTSFLFWSLYDWLRTSCQAQTKKQLICITCHNTWYWKLTCQCIWIMKIVLISCLILDTQMINNIGGNLYWGQHKEGMCFFMQKDPCFIHQSILYTNDETLFKDSRWW